MVFRTPCIRGLCNMLSSSVFRFVDFSFVNHEVTAHSAIITCVVVPVEDSLELNSESIIGICVRGEEGILYPELAERRQWCHRRRLLFVAKIDLQVSFNCTLSKSVVLHTLSLKYLV